MSAGIQNALALAQETVQKAKKFVKDDKYPWFKWVMNRDGEKIDEVGLKIELYLTQDGGDTFFTYSNSSFRNYIPAEYDTMRVYPARHAKALEFQGEMLRKLKDGNEKSFISFEKLMKDSSDSARKTLSRTGFHNDGTGTVSIATNSIGSTGAATLQGMYVTSGSSAMASTKGTSWLKKNEYYDAINPSTEAVRGTFYVTSEGKRSCGVYVTSGTVAANDLIVVKGSYKKTFVGIRHLCHWANRILQNYLTTNNTSLNTPYVDMGGNAITPSAFADAKTLIETDTNDAGEAMNNVILMTPGHKNTLVKQEFQYREHIDPKGNETMMGVSGWKYVDADGDVHLLDADAPDDEIRGLSADNYKFGTSKAWGLYDDDGNEFRMKHGDNGAGSDEWFKAIGVQGQLYKEGRGLCDFVITDLAHSGDGFITQSFVNS